MDRRRKKQRQRLQIDVCKSLQSTAFKLNGNHRTSSLPRDNKRRWNIKGDVGIGQLRIDQLQLNNRNTSNPKKICANVRGRG